MKKYTLLESDLKELQTFASWFRSHYPDIILKDSKYGSEFEKNKEISELAALLGYRGKAIYKVTKYKILTQHSIGVLNLYIKKLGEETSNDPARSIFIKKINIFLRKLQQQQSIGKSDRQKSENLIFQNNDTISQFKGKKYYCYERHLESIGRKVIEFGDYCADEKLSVSIYPAQKELSNWTGIAYCDSSQDFLMIDSYNGSTESANTNYMIRVEKNCKSLDLCCGHMTFQHLTNKSVVTKTIIIEKTSDGIAAEPQEFKLNDEAELEGNVKSAIRRFLWDREKNRLTNPHKMIITNYDILEKWQKENDGEILYGRNDNLLGDYYIYYSKSDLKDYKKNQSIVLTRANLKIFTNFNLDVVATYEYQIDKNKPYFWEGTVFASAVTKSASILLHGPLLKSSSGKRPFVKDDKPIFLMLDTPSQEKSFDTLTGILSGIKDNDEGSISVLIVAIRKDSSRVKDNNFEDQLMKFYKSYILRAWVRPPLNCRVTTFDDLADAIEEGNKTTQLIKEMFSNP